MAVLWIATTGFCSTYLFASGIPFATGPHFADNPLAANVSLPPLPDALRPMGPPKPVPLPRSEPIVSPLPDVDSTPSKAKDSKDLANADGDVPIAPEAPAPEVKEVTVSPFNAWIAGDKDAAAVARAERAKYKDPNDGAPAPADSQDNDLMLNIRYPYTWNQQQPPSASAVIYTVPKR